MLGPLIRHPQSLNPESQHAQVMQKIATEAIVVFDAAEDVNGIEKT